MNKFRITGLKETFFRRPTRATFGALLISAGIVLCAPVASAQDGNGDTILNGCMDDLFPGSLGCTANDVRVSGVADVTGDMIVDEADITFKPICDAGATNAGWDCSSNPAICTDVNGPNPELCGDRCAFPGDTTQFAATFIVELSAQARYDIGLYFGVDGDPNKDGALTGSCSISTLPEVGSFERPTGHPAGPTGLFVDLDTDCKGGGCPQPQDLCGDIDNESNPIFYNLASTGNFIAATCIGNEDNELLLPSCTSWRQSGANEVCLSPLDAFPGSPSKCNCDPAFSVPVNVPPAELLVTKTATPTSVDEPGDTVRFDVSVTNTGVDPNNKVTLNVNDPFDLLPEGLDDDIYGDITQVQGAILFTTCVVPQTITPGGSYTCSFEANVSGNGGDRIKDTVTASGVDDNGNAIAGSDDAIVTVVDLLPEISVDKTAVPTEVLEPGGDVAFTVEVFNDSPADALTLTSLTDDIHGDLNGKGDCSVPQTIALNGSYTCSFTARVSGVPGDSEKDIVTAVGEDDEGNSVSNTDNALVNINDVPSEIELIKAAGDNTVSEPGDDVTFTFTVNNKSDVDAVTINSLVDDIYGDLDGKGDCSVPQSLAVGESYSCSATFPVPPLLNGNAGDVFENTAEASGTDDDGNFVSDDDIALVNVIDVPPAASLTKEATMVVATFEVVVTNDSSAESLELSVLNDDEFGNITVIDGETILDSSCTVPQTIKIGGSYTCSFDAKVSTSPHTDTVTGTVLDDDGGSVTPSDSATVTFE